MNLSGGSGPLDASELLSVPWPNDLAILVRSGPGAGLHDQYRPVPTAHAHVSPDGQAERMLVHAGHVTLSLWDACYSTVRYMYNHNEHVDRILLKHQLELKCRPS